MIEAAGQEPQSAAERLRAAIKPRDAWWARLVVGPVANRVVGRVAPVPSVTPNRVTVASLGVGLLAAACLSVGRQPALAAGGFLVQISFLLDCVDGQLARFHGKSTLFGAIMDRLADRIKLFAVTFAIAWGLGDMEALGAGFLYFFTEYMRDQYVSVYRRFAADAVPTQGPPPPSVDTALLALRPLDLPIISLGFADRYFLISVLSVLGATRFLIYLLLTLGMLHLILRPFYYVLVFRSQFGRWPWHDERRHRLGQNL